jgi:hypothetical protein
MRLTFSGEPSLMGTRATGRDCIQGIGRIGRNDRLQEIESLGKRNVWVRCLVWLNFQAGGLNDGCTGAEVHIRCIST